MNKEFPIESDLAYKAKLSSYIILILVLDIALNVLLIIFLKNILYLIIAVTIANFVVCLWFGKLLTTWIVFPYSLWFIRCHQHKFMNTKLTKEMRNLFLKAYDIIEGQMLQSTHKITTCATYKDYSKSMVKFCDMVDIFSTVNQLMLKKDLEKQMKAKRSSSKLPILFKDSTDCLAKIEKLLKEIRIKPFRGPEHSIWSFYYGLNEFERISNDSMPFQRTGDNNVQIFSSERTFPIIHPEDQNKLTELTKQTKKFVECCEISSKPVPCCCKRRRRTSCLCCFRPIFGSPKQMGMILQKTFQGNHFKLKTDDPKVTLDCMFFSATSEKMENEKQESTYHDLNTFILCNPNAMVYQHMVNQPHGFYLKYFLSKNINVIVWNYRKYGLSQGAPNIINTKKDADLLFKHAKEVMGLRGKIGVYGRSLGGIPTTYLADKAQMIIADRTFCNFEILANRKFYSGIAKYLFKIGSCGWFSNNDSNVILKGNGTCYKVIMTEKNDEVVDVHSSLMAGVARSIIGRKYMKAGEKFFLSRKDIQAFIHSIRFITNLEHDFFTIIDFQNQHHLGFQAQHSAQNSMVGCLGRSMNASSKISPLDPESQKQSETSIQNAEESTFNDLPSAQEKALCLESLKNLRSALTNQCVTKDTQISRSMIGIHSNILPIVEQMYSLPAAMLTFYDVCNINKIIEPLEIENFIILMEVYGATPEIQTSFLELYNHRTQRDVSRSQVEKLCLILKEQVEKLSKLKMSNLEYSVEIDIIIYHCNQLQRTFDSIFEYLQLKTNPFKDASFNTVANFQHLEEISPGQIGHIVPVTCGHTGQPSTQEVYYLDKHMQESGFWQFKDFTSANVQEIKARIEACQANQNIIKSPKKIQPRAPVCEDKQETQEEQPPRIIINLLIQNNEDQDQPLSTCPNYNHQSNQTLTQASKEQSQTVSLINDDQKENFIEQN